MEQNPFESINRAMEEDSLRKATLELELGERTAFRKLLYERAQSALQAVFDDLTKEVSELTPHAIISRSNGLDIGVGNVKLGTDPVRPLDENRHIDVVAYSAVGVIQPEDRYRFAGRAHSLWYCDPITKGDFEWFELGFMSNPLSGRRTTVEPYNLPPTSEDAWVAISPTMHTVQMGYNFQALLAKEFVERWIGWFALAAQGKLQSSGSIGNTRLTIRAS
ncbi:MAG: hypothetical protein ABL949_03305 [Fimbriimonadaceae bacterium]